MKKLKALGSLEGIVIERIEIRRIHNPENYNNYDYLKRQRVLAKVIHSYCPGFANAYYNYGSYIQDRVGEINLPNEIVLYLKIREKEKK